MEGIFEVRSRDGLMRHDVRLKSPKDWFRHSEVSSGDLQAQLYGTEIAMPTLNFGCYLEEISSAKGKTFVQAKHTTVHD
jgi:hypothetical protein